MGERNRAPYRVGPCLFNPHRENRNGEILQTLDSRPRKDSSFGSSAVVRAGLVTTRLAPFLSTARARRSLKFCEMQIHSLK
jgi:hypothetical protein